MMIALNTLHPKYHPVIPYSHECSEHKVMDGVCMSVNAGDVVVVVAPSLAIAYLIVLPACIDTSNMTPT